MSTPTKKQPNTPTWLSAHDIAQELQVSLSKAYQVARALPHFRIPGGRTLRVSAADFNAYLQANTTRGRHV